MAKKTEIMIDDVANRPLGEPVEANEDGYVAVKWSEYKELLITKGKYEELKSQKESTIQYIPSIQPLTTPYPADLMPKYQPNTIFCDKKDELKLQNNVMGVK